MRFITQSFVGPNSPWFSAIFSGSIKGKTSCIIGLAATCLLTVSGSGAADAAQPNMPLRLVSATPMPDFAGDFDHFASDLKGNRLFLSAEEHQSVEVFDLHTGARVHSIMGFSHPLTMVYLPESNHLLVTDFGPTEKGQGSVHLVDCSNYRIIGTIPLPSSVDESEYNPVDKNFYVESDDETPSKDSHLLNIIDTQSFKLIGTISLPGPIHEGTCVDRAGKYLYFNNTGINELGVLDLVTRQVVARWAMPVGANAHALALDESSRRLFSATREPGLLNVFDVDTHKLVASLPCVGVNSNMWIDAARKRIYVTGSGAISVFKQIDADHYEHLADVPSAYRAKSSWFEPSLNRLYVAASNKKKPEVKMQLLIFEPQD